MGSFVVDAALSRTHGQPYYNTTLIDQTSSNVKAQQPFNQLEFTIAVQHTDTVLVSNSVPINSTDNLFDFSFTKLKPRLEAYDIVLYGASPDGNQTYTATTQLFYLPDKTTGSITKIDHLNGGMLFKNNATNYAFVPVLPHGWYTDYSGYLQLSLENVQKYYDLGFNVIHPVTGYFDSDNFTTIIDYMDQINLLWQYDMRGSYLNLTAVAQQVPLVMNHSSFLAYYTADEPDGWEYALNSTKLAYDLIASIDKYHPVGLVLNCQNFYYGQYSSGADYIMEDAYPIGINATWSIPWNTPCNDTYGDCGCDNCVGELTDVSNRIDDLYEYQSWLAQSPSKPVWAVPQSFDGEGYWSRYPTVDETWAMNSLALNHGAKGIMLWIFPSLDDLNTANSQQAKVITVDPVLGFLTGAKPLAINVPKQKLLDVAYWVVGNQVLVSVVNLQYTDSKAEIAIPLPFVNTSSAGTVHIASTPWGSVQWTLSSGASELKVKGLAALATSMVIIDL